jgi:hypothetical protein
MPYGSVNKLTSYLPSINKCWPFPSTRPSKKLPITLFPSL